ncbi:tripartite tricarboxylate transporter TctB family protein [Promicromonospora sp. NPDC052451]|uniref:tripartite tricarboxylate transporter TctB family protein n=1 Tax=Promicromonospora sp. NPDC052451 TaxID=3364407 RepID=UPI0037CA9954
MTSNDNAVSTAHTPSAAAARPDRGSVPLAVVVLVVAAYLTYGTVTMTVSPSASPPGPRFFPVIVTVVAYVVGLLLLVQGVRGRLRPAPAEAPDADAGAGAGTDADRIDWRQVGIVVGTFAVFILVLEPVGWLVSGALLFTGVSYGLGSSRHLVNVGAGLALSSVIQLAFAGGLGLPLPAGILAGV